MKSIDFKEVGKAAVAVIICQLAGAVGSIATASSVSTWYAALSKPWFTPPNWAFGPAWATIYTLIGIAAYLVWREGPDKPNIRFALSVFGVQLVLNALWSFVFFWFRSLAGGFIFIVIVLAAAVYNAFIFYRISRPAGLLFAPYILWGGFATAVAFYTWVLN